MKTEIRKILNLASFFALKYKSNQNLIYNLAPTSKIILHNIHLSWLQSINMKTQVHLPVYLSYGNKKENNISYGIVEKTFSTYPNDIGVAEKMLDCDIENKSILKLNLIVPKQDVMQYFFQWQRYRKYWWSSITTTPSLFAVNEMKYESTSTDTQIVANFSCGQQVVEHLSIKNNANDSETTGHITCRMSLETALITLMLDGLLSQNKDEYLKLHNKMAPYKISFALNSTDDKQSDILTELATLLHNKLNLANITSWLPNFSLPFQYQLTENLRIGVPYTAILNNETLTTGIFYLLNSSTMLKEQVHLADLEQYAQLLFNKT